IAVIRSSAVKPSRSLAVILALRLGSSLARCLPVSCFHESKTFATAASSETRRGYVVSDTVEGEGEGELSSWVPFGLRSGLPVGLTLGFLYSRGAPFFLGLPPLCPFNRAVSIFSRYFLTSWSALSWCHSEFRKTKNLSKT